MMHFLCAIGFPDEKQKCLETVPFCRQYWLRCISADPPSPRGHREGGVIKGTAVDTLWRPGEGWGERQIDCVSTIAAGKEKALGDRSNVKSKINDVPVWKGNKMEVKFNKAWLKREGFRRPFSAARQLPEK